MYDNVSYKKTSPCAKVALNWNNLDFNFKSSLTAFCHWVLQLSLNSSVSPDGSSYLNSTLLKAHLHVIVTQSNST